MAICFLEISMFQARNFVYPVVKFSDDSDCAVQDRLKISQNLYERFVQILWLHEVLHGRLKIHILPKIHTNFG